VLPVRGSPNSGAIQQCCRAIQHFSLLVIDFCLLTPEHLRCTRRRANNSTLRPSLLSLQSKQMTPTCLPVPCSSTTPTAPPLAYLLLKLSSVLTLVVLALFSKDFSTFVQRVFLYNAFPDLYSIIDMTNTMFHNSTHFSHL